jgi:hypothetical protein
VRVTSPNTVEAQRRLSEFHDKLLAAMGRFNTQITAYTGTASLPPDELDIDLSKRLQSISSSNPDGGIRFREF